MERSLGPTPHLRGRHQRSRVHPPRADRRRHPRLRRRALRLVRHPAAGLRGGAGGRRPARHRPADLSRHDARPALLAARRRIGGRRPPRRYRLHVRRPDQRAAVHADRAASRRHRQPVEVDAVSVRRRARQRLVRRQSHRQRLLVGHDGVRRAGRADRRHHRRRLHRRRAGGLSQRLHHAVPQARAAQHRRHGR